MGNCKDQHYSSVWRYGGNVVDFAGWEMPIEYEGLVPEHNAVECCRNVRCIHMGPNYSNGKDAEAFMQYMVSNDVSAAGQTDTIYIFVDGWRNVDDFLFTITIRIAIC